MLEAQSTMSDAPVAPARADLARRLVEDFLAPAAEVRAIGRSYSSRHYEILRELKAALKAGLTATDLAERTSARGHPHGEAVVAALAQRLIDGDLIRVVRQGGTDRRYYLSAKGSNHLATLARRAPAKGRRLDRRPRITDVLGMGTEALKALISRTLADNHPELLGPAEVAEKMGLERAAGTGTIRVLLQELVAEKQADWIELRPGCGVYRAAPSLLSDTEGLDRQPVSAVAGSVLRILAGSPRAVEVATLARDLALPKAALRLPMFELKQGGFAVRKRRRGVVSYIATETGRAVAAAL